MGSTFYSLQTHLVFSTKNRVPFLTPEIRSRVHAYLGGCCRALDVVALEVGGVEDHLHAEIAHKPKHSLSDVVREIKKGTSIWIHEELKIADFAWQEGYGAFSVSRSNQEAVRRYIQNQEEHHRKKTFEEEYRELLRAHGISFDERYLL